MGHPTVDKLIRDLSNWGRWGPEDELGTTNFITPKKRVQAAQLVSTGKAFSLAIPFNRRGPQPADTRRTNPHLTMLATGTDLRAGVQGDEDNGEGSADDMVTMALQAATHWDAPSHVFYDYRMYNDRPCELVDADGAHKNDITPFRDRIITRGVLVDVARQLGVDALAPDHRITVAQLEATLESQRVEVQSGDILLFRTGNLARGRANSWNNFCSAEEPEPGIGLDALPWLHEHQIAAIAADTWAVEVLPNETGKGFPVHKVTLVHFGLLLGEFFDLDELADDCEQDGVYEFLFSAPPLPFTGAVGSPINPIALK